MIKIETLEVSGFKGAILGMRNPFKNRDRSDSGFKSMLSGNYEDETGMAIDPNFVNDNMRYRFAPVLIGPKDLDLCQKLVRAGGDDDAKFLRMIHVQADVTAPLYWWKEFDTYKVATVANSESTMHTIAKKQFTLDDFAYEKLQTIEDDDEEELTEPSEFLHMLNQRLRDKDIDVPDDDLELMYPIDILTSTIHMLNACREAYIIANETGRTADAYIYWYNMIQLLPSSYMQKRTVDLNYQTLRRIFFARRHHKLTEWAGEENSFCVWIETLPYAKELITYEGK